MVTDLEASDSTDFVSWVNGCAREKKWGKEQSKHMRVLAHTTPQRPWKKGRQSIGGGSLPTPTSQLPRSRSQHRALPAPGASPLQRTKAREDTAEYLSQARNKSWSQTPQGPLSHAFPDKSRSTSFNNPWKHLLVGYLLERCDKARITETQIFMNHLPLLGKTNKKQSFLFWRSELNSLVQGHLLN